MTPKSANEKIILSQNWPERYLAQKTKEIGNIFKQICTKSFVELWEQLQLYVVNFFKYLRK